jgi:hypothetical protein
MRDLLPEEIPLFPLAGVALFPDLPLPLHIFEPRYRRMVKDALDGPRIIGIILPRPAPSGSGGAESIPPALFEVGGAGRIEGIAELPDGRSNIVLRGLSRFRVDEELQATDRPYRRARVTALVESVRDEKALTDSLAQVLHEIGQVDEGMSLLARDDEAPKTLVVNMLCQLLPLQDVERQSLVEAPTADERAARLLTILEFARLAKSLPRGSETRH